jgi:uncharacterized protein (DUF1800 family)
MPIDPPETTHGPRPCPPGPTPGAGSFRVAPAALPLLVLPFLACAFLAAGWLAPRPASAAAPAPVLNESQAVWRAASRLGYFPSEERAAAIRAHPGGPRGWALDEVDRALEASRQPARVPDTLPTVVTPLPSVFAEARREREERLKSVQAASAAAAARQAQPVQMQPELAQQQMQQQMQAQVRQPMQPAPQVAPQVSSPVAPPPFTLTSARQAAAWRMLSCSDPALENPLLSRMTEFWFNHLNVFAGRLTVRPFAGNYVVHAIRPNVLGRFEDLLLASARHPAMLFYLDQNQNVADGTPGPQGRLRGINENYARELMELHTLGIEGGYTQRDVRELARVLTGWTVDPNGPSGFRFVARLHDNGEKTVLGRRFGGPAAAQGEAEGLEAIAMLASRPATARRISLRLAQFFVADEPPRALVERLAAEFLAGDGDLRRVMRLLVASPEFWDPAHELFKTPYDFACSALGLSARAATGAPEGAAPVAATAGAQRPAPVALALGFLASAGQPVNGWQTPDGYRTDAATWLSPESLTRRADLAAALARGAGDPEHLLAFYEAPTRERIRRFAPGSRAAFALAAPDFMRK